MKRKVHKHYFLLRVSKRKTIRIGVPVKDAKQQVILSRTNADILAGREGMSITCANAECSLREEMAFPHPVLMACFTDNRAFFVDKLDRNGQPTSCVRYAHNEGEFQKQFDRKGKQALTKMSGAEKMFVLTPPPRHRPPGKGISHGGTSGPDGKARKREMTGDLARAKRSGMGFDKPRENG